MKDLVLQIAKALVDHGDEVKVSVIERNSQVLIEVTVNPEDVGKIIGKQGRIIKAIRTLVKACATLDNKKVAVELTNK